MQTIPKILKPVAGLAAALAIIALAGCMSTADRSSGRVYDDKKITSKVEGALKDARVYKFDDVKVVTFNGVVQLSGFVDSVEQKQKAGEITKRVEWVRDVVNNISLKPNENYPTPTGRSSGERNIDTSTSTSPRASDATTAPSSSSTNRATNP